MPTVFYDDQSVMGLLATALETISGVQRLYPGDADPEDGSTPGDTGRSVRLYEPSWTMPLRNAADSIVGRIVVRLRVVCDERAMASDGAYALARLASVVAMAFHSVTLANAGKTLFVEFETAVHEPVVDPDLPDAVRVGLLTIAGQVKQLSGTPTGY